MTADSSPTLGWAFPPVLEAGGPLTDPATRLSFPNR
jgi:hypothetical protein